MCFVKIKAVSLMKCGAISAKGKHIDIKLTTLLRENDSCSVKKRVVTRNFCKKCGQHGMKVHHLIWLMACINGYQLLRFLEDAQENLE